MVDDQRVAVTRTGQDPSGARPKRRRAGFPDRAHIQLTDRDVAILRDLTRFWALTVEQVARRHFRATNTAANRLAALVRAGYVRVERPRYRGRAAYLVTASGARLADVVLPAARFSPMALPHRLAVVDLADLLLIRSPGATWTSERELRRDSMQTVRDRRRGQLLSGTPHVPDGVLTIPGGPAGGIAIELELSGKKLADHERILRWYGAALDYQQVRWFCATTAIRERIAKLVERERMDDFITAEPVPPGVGGTSWG